MHPAQLAGSQWGSHGGGGGLCCQGMAWHPCDGRAHQGGSCWAAGGRGSLGTGYLPCGSICILTPCKTGSCCCDRYSVTTGAGKVGVVWAGDSLEESLKVAVAQVHALCRAGLELAVFTGDGGLG